MTIAASQTQIVRINMAGIDYADRHQVLETLLGSCVGVVLWDRVGKTAALAHVVLPDSNGVQKPAGKFADTAVAELRRMMMRHGANPRRLVAKIAGGATMFGPRTIRDVGRRNCEAVKEHLRQVGIPIVAEDLGGGQGRQIRFSPVDGKLEVFIRQKLVNTL